jgi:hypothetical protein
MVVVRVSTPMPRPTHPPPPRRSASKRPPPKPPRQATTGLMRFGLDARGVFISGVDAQKLLGHLVDMYPDVEKEREEGQDATLHNIYKVLNLVNEPPDSSLKGQILKPYWECLNS